MNSNFGRRMTISLKPLSLSSGENNTYSLRLADGLAVLLALFFAVYLRYTFRYVESGDFRIYTSVWYASVRDHGFSSAGTAVSNYTPTYLYILYFTSRIFEDLAPVVAIKIPSIACDFICASFVYLIVRLKYPHGREPLFAFMAVIFAPTVVMNSGMWGQADSIYTSVLLACVYCLLTRRTTLAVLALGIALSLKFQAMFLAPALFAIWLRSRAPYWTLALIPLIYTIMMVPAWYAGRPAMELASVYLSQGAKYHSLTMNAPSLYTWLPQAYYYPLVVSGLLLTMAVVAIYVWVIWRSKVEMTDSVILQLCMLSLIMTPFLLPKMHDRFFYPADVLAIAYGFFFPRHAFVPVFVVFASFFAYQPFLFGKTLVPLPVLSLIMAFALFAVGQSAWRMLAHPKA
jgi:Gpi18-like mannosyltransferase